MYKPTDKQRGLFGADSGLNERLRGLLHKSWAEGFQREVLPILLAKEDEFAHLYSRHGRPNWSVARMVGLLVLRELLLLKSDRELAESFAFDRRFQHALDVSDASDQVISERSIAAFRARLAHGDPEGELLESVFTAVSETVIRRLGVSTKEQRTDSTFVKSNIKRRNRRALVQETLRAFLLELQRRDRLEEVADEIRQWLAELQGWDSSLKLAQLGRWIHELVTQFAADDEVSQSEAYATLVEVFAQHFEVADDADEEPDDPDEESDDAGDPPTRGASSSPRRRGGRSASKAKKDKRKKQRKSRRKNRRVADDVTPLADVRGGIQSPHDVDARKGRKGVGYQLHVTETCRNEGVEVITDVAVTTANQHDSTQLPGILQRLSEHEQSPAVLYADGAYPTLDNLDEAARQGVELCAPVHRGNLAAHHPKLSREDFRFDHEGRVVACPQGQRPRRHAPLRGSAVSNVALHVLFDGARCAGCPTLGRCPTQAHNRGKERKLCIDPRLRERDARLREQQARQWRARYRVRAGIEATMSELARAHGAKELTVRGLAMVRMRVFLKATACNVKRCLRALATVARGRPEEPGAGPTTRPWRPYSGLQNALITLRSFVAASTSRAPAIL